MVVIVMPDMHETGPPKDYLWAFFFFMRSNRVRNQARNPSQRLFKLEDFLDDRLVLDSITFVAAVVAVGTCAGNDRE